MFHENPGCGFKHLKRHMAFAPKGFIRYYVLRLLSEKPMSGSEIMQYIEDKSEGHWRPSPGSIYPLLAWLQEKKYIQEVPTEEAGIKRYTLTEEGKKFLQEHEKRRDEMEKRFHIFGPGFGFIFEPPWFVMPPKHVKNVIKEILKLRDTLWKLRSATFVEAEEEVAAQVTEILKETSEKIEKLIKELEKKRNT